MGVVQIHWNQDTNR